MNSVSYCKISKNGLKIPRSQGCAGSSPALGIKRGYSIFAIASFCVHGLEANPRHW